MKVNVSFSQKDVIKYRLRRIFYKLDFLHDQAIQCTGGKQVIRRAVYKLFRGRVDRLRKAIKI